jgi:hypothetical protein
MPRKAKTHSTERFTGKLRQPLLMIKRRQHHPFAMMQKKRKLPQLHTSAMSQRAIVLRKQDRLRQLVDYEPSSPQVGELWEKLRQDLGSSDEEKPGETKKWRAINRSSIDVCKIFIEFSIPETRTRIALSCEWIRIRVYVYHSASRRSLWLLLPNDYGRVCTTSLTLMLTMNCLQHFLLIPTTGRGWCIGKTPSNGVGSSNRHTKTGWLVDLPHAGRKKTCVRLFVAVPLPVLETSLLKGKKANKIPSLESACQARARTLLKNTHLFF